MSDTTYSKQVHEGRNVKRFREMLGLKQDALADALGDDWNQKKVSLLEAKESIEPAILDQVAKALNIPVAAIKNFDEQGAVTYFNTFNDNSLSNSNGAFSASQCTFNPLSNSIGVCPNATNFLNTCWVPIAPKDIFSKKLSSVLNDAIEYIVPVNCQS